MKINNLSNGVQLWINLQWRNQSRTIKKIQTMSKTNRKG